MPLPWTLGQRDQMRDLIQQVSNTNKDLERLNSILRESTEASKGETLAIRELVVAIDRKTDAWREAANKEIAITKDEIRFVKIAVSVASAVFLAICGVIMWIAELASKVKEIVHK